MSGLGISGNKFNDFNTEKSKAVKEKNSELKTEIKSEVKETKNENKTPEIKENKIESKNNTNSYNKGDFSPVTKQFPMFFGAPNNLNAIKSPDLSGAAGGLGGSSQASLSMIEKLRSINQQSDGELSGIKHK